MYLSFAFFIPSFHSSSSLSVCLSVSLSVSFSLQILNQRSEALSSINHRLEQVPLSVCQKLEQCIRSTEVNYTHTLL